MGALVILALLVAACTVGPDYHPPASVSLKVPDRFQNGTANRQGQTDLRTWWTLFNDPVLTGLIDSALVANNDLDAASAVQSLLESERSLLSSEDSRATARAARATAAVQLYKALGGGWSDADIPPETRR